MFCNRRGTMLKIPYWENTGFCLWTKRLEQQRFPWPKNEGEVSRISEGSPLGMPRSGHFNRFLTDCTQIIALFVRM